MLLDGTYSLLTSKVMVPQILSITHDAIMKNSNNHKLQNRAHYNRLALNYQKKMNMNSTTHINYNPNDCTVTTANAKEQNKKNHSQESTFA
jgi:methionine-rich copper-binding protein CopC